MTTSLRIGVMSGGYNGRRLAEHARFIESLGYDSFWTGEAYGGDAVTALTWVAAHTERLRIGSSILQLDARTPSNTAMTAWALNQLSRGRFSLGLGVSGPQVVEGWHGRPFRFPLARTREYVTVIRRLLEEQGRIEFHGDHLSIPYDGPDATGLGKPLRPGFPRTKLPIYLAAMGPKNIAMATEIADGLLPLMWSPHRLKEIYGDLIAAAAARNTAAGAEAGAAPFDIRPAVPVAVGDDIAACRDQVRPNLAFYLGGMGARTENFYANLIRRYGYEQDADTIQDLYLGGRREEAAAAIPDALVDELTLVGPPAAIADQLAVWESSGATGLLIRFADDRALRTVAEVAF
ncbi:LLM class F420-dependent oxidoreductase [Frankia sp. AvcI1]|uniref:LLM class F420-dependent oxidoreductase n=1 Tax=Frankia sp. AvcI1 TaxID=573496 RepID=UPI0006EBF051|nr:LLM class F420-dependent oxidoreductase [Frankia sp. AvcI1]